ncbi:MAG: glycosyltransferase family 2 protein [Stellaceae bacterium]
MLVSIVVTNHNYARFLHAAMDSALAQSWHSVEVIVVDDGSTDGSRGIIEGYGGRVRAIFQANGGQTSAFNAGFAASSGEVVIFLDADDRLLRGCVETVMRVWKSDTAKVQYRLNTIDAEGQDLRMPFPHYTRRLRGDVAEARRQLLMVGSYAWPVSSGNAFSRAFLQKALPLPPEFRRAPDGLLNRLVPLYGPVITLPDILADYRVHGANVLAQQDLAPEKYAANVKYEIERESFFSRRALAFGYEVSDTILLRNKKHLETRLLSLKLSPALHPLPGDSVGRLAWLGVVSTLWALDLRFFGRLIWALWFISLSVLPRRALTFLVRHMRLQSGRATIARFVLRLSRRS